MHVVHAETLSVPIKEPTHREPFQPFRVGSLMLMVFPADPIGVAPPRTEASEHCRALDPTTSFLTAAALIYAIGAGITAGAGTRLVLQLILIDRFRYRPLQTSHDKVA